MIVGKKGVPLARKVEMKKGILPGFLQDGHGSSQFPSCVN
jgi:hypothetical protein